MLPNARFGVHVIHNCSNLLISITCNNIMEYKIPMILGFNEQIGYICCWHIYNNIIRASDVYINSELIND